MNNELISKVQHFDPSVIGLEFIRYSKAKLKRVETITDILTTTNLQGDVVKRVYVTQHDFMGQKMTDNDVNPITIARSI